MVLQMPAARDFGWPLKPNDSSAFGIQRQANGQFAVVLHHALLRGVRAEMIAWWFKHFCTLRVGLDDVPGYDGQSVPAYLLWHPSDHVDARLEGDVAADGTAKVGSTILIKEAMQYLTHGLRFPVDQRLQVFYVGEDGWAMGLAVDGTPMMMLRIHFADVVEGGAHLGVQYHYEIVVGRSDDTPEARAINAQIGSQYGETFFQAWQTHNVIEVGTFEAFLSPLWDQRGSLATLRYRPSMAPALPDTPQAPHDRSLFDARLAGYAGADDAFAFQAYDRPSFL